MARPFPIRPFRKHKNFRKGIYLLPNLITTAALFCGFFSIINSINGHFIKAAWLILLAGLFDLLDGRVARLTRTHSDFGIEYDSLSDLASFGLAPAILAYSFSLHHFQKFGWAAAFLFFACGALRLARFNVQIDTVEKKHFQGLPIPPAAAVIISFVIFKSHFLGPELQTEAYWWDYLFISLVVSIALLMVSNIRYRSFKRLRLNRKQSFFALVLTAVLIFFVASMPELMLFSLTLLYLVSGIVEEVIFQVRKRSNRFQTEEYRDLPPADEEKAERLKIIKS